MARPQETAKKREKDMKRQEKREKKRQRRLDKKALKEEGAASGSGEDAPKWDPMTKNQG